MAIPTNLREVQGLVGKLMYAVPRMPHYKEHVQPIKALLSKRGDVWWTGECTTAINDLLWCIYTRVHLVSADPYGSLVMYPSVHDRTGFIACM